MKILVTWKSYPSSKAATEYSARRANARVFFEYVTMVFSLFTIVWYILGVTELFGKVDYIFYLKSLLAITITAGAFFLLVVVYEEMTDRKCLMIMLKEKAAIIGAADVKIQINDIRSHSRKKIIDGALWFFGGYFLALLFLTGVIGCIKSITLINHKNGGTIGLIISLVLVACSSLLFFLYYRKKYL